MSGFLLKLEHELAAAPVPPEGTFATARPRPSPVPVVSSSSALGDGGLKRHCHAFLQAFAKPGMVKMSSFAAENNYVIIGRGPAATTNLATLRSRYGAGRTAGMHIIVVGRDDPWSHYVSHDMNQEIELLSLPGYRLRLKPAAPATKQRWMNSKKFADLNQKEMARSQAEHNWRSFDLVSAGVTSIDKLVDLASGKVRYQINLDREQLNPLIATHVDICTGTGQQTYAEAKGPVGKGKQNPRGIDMCDVLWNEYLNPVPGSKPRIVSAEMFVVGPCQVRPDASVLITSANSPAGLQAGEHALGLDGGDKAAGAAKEVLLISAETMNGGFPPIGRLDGLARTAVGPLPVRLGALDVNLFPTDKKMWFGEFYRVSQIEILNATHIASFRHAADNAEIADLPGAKLLVTLLRLDTAKHAAPRLVQGLPLGAEIAEPLLAPPHLYGLFDQVVLSTGRTRGGREAIAEDEEGSALSMVWKFQDDLTPITRAGYEFPLGLETKDGGALRILGAAGINNPIYHSKAGAKKKLLEYEKSLPAQARVNNEGITLAGVTIALANNYFACARKDYNANLNTATRAELEILLGADLGGKVFDLRHSRVKPFQSMREIIRALGYALNKESLGDANLLALLNNTDWLLDSEEWSAYKSTVDAYRPLELQRRDQEVLSALQRLQETYADIPQMMEYEDFIDSRISVGKMKSENT